MFLTTTAYCSYVCDINQNFVCAIKQSSVNDLNQRAINQRVFVKFTNVFCVTKPKICLRHNKSYVFVIKHSNVCDKVQLNSLKKNVFAIDWSFVCDINQKCVCYSKQCLVCNINQCLVCYIDISLCLTSKICNMLWHEPKLCL